MSMYQPISFILNKRFKLLSIGVTNLQLEDFETWISEISDQYTYSTYNILENNCNNFSHEACMFLTGNSIPDHIRNLPNEFKSTPLGQMFAPMINQFTENMKQQSMLRNGFDPNQFMSIATENKPQSFPNKANTISPVIKSPEECTYFLSLKKPDNMDTIFNKVHDLPFELSEAETQLFNSTNTLFHPDSTIDQAHIHTVDLLEKMILTLDPSEAYTPIFLLRLAIAKTEVNKIIAGKTELVHKVLEDFSKPEVPIKARVMGALLISNLFADEAGVSRLLEDTIATKAITFSLSLFHEEKEQPRLAGSALLHNYCTAFYKRGETGNEELHSLILISLSEILLNEDVSQSTTESGVNVLTRVIISLAYLLKLGEFNKVLLEDLGILQETEKLISHNNKPLSSLVKEFHAMF